MSIGAPKISGKIGLAPFAFYKTPFQRLESLSYFTERYSSGWKAICKNTNAILAARMAFVFLQMGVWWLEWRLLNAEWGRRFFGRVGTVGASLLHFESRTKQKFKQVLNAVALAASLLHTRKRRCAKLLLELGDLLELVVFGR